MFSIPREVPAFAVPQTKMFDPRPLAAKGKRSGNLSLSLAYRDKMPLPVIDNVPFQQSARTVSDLTPVILHKRQRPLGLIFLLRAGRRSTSLNMCLSNLARGAQCLQYLTEVSLL